MKLVIACCLLFPAGLGAQQLKSETAQQFGCYVQSAEARMDARKAFLLADTDTALNKLIRMLQDYDHRAQYFPETIATSKLLCLTGTDHFQSSMRMKEPAILDVESDVVWERVDAQRWRCRSLSMRVAEVGKDHGYLRRLNSYWRFAET